jgi:hypothetical protein
MATFVTRAVRTSSPTSWNLFKMWSRLYHSFNHSKYNPNCTRKFRNLSKTWPGLYLNGSVMSSFRFLISPLPSVYQRKCSSQLKAPQCSSKLLTYANVSSLIMSITGHTTRVLSSAILVIKLSSQPGHKTTKYHSDFDQNLCTLKNASTTL